MREIETEFTSKGFTFTQLDRKRGPAGEVVLFQKTITPPSDGTWLGFEVMFVKICKSEVVMTDKKTGLKRVAMAVGDQFLPGDAKWGTEGWSYPTIQEAQRKFNELLARPAKIGKGEE